MQADEKAADSTKAAGFDQEIRRDDDDGPSYDGGMM